jgi:DNA replication protein DnaC
MSFSGRLPPFRCPVHRGKPKKASTILTTNRAYKHWPEILNNDATLTAALLDRLVHYLCTVVIEGRSYRTKDQITPP